MSLSTQAAQRPLELQPWFSGTSFLVIVRLALFATCRKFIDRSLYNGLKQISQGSPAETLIELDALPPPSAHSTPERRSTNDTSHSLLSKTLFSLCFSESCTLFLLLMCQALDVFNTRVRLLNWQISLYAVLLNIIILIPLSLCLVSTTSSNSSLGLRRVLTILAPLSVYFLLLSYVPLPDAIVSSGMSDTFTLVTARYNVLGIFILGSLSGFGSVTTAWGYFPLRCGRNRKIPTQAELDRAEQSLTRIRADLVSKRRDVTSLKMREASQSEGAQKSSWLSRVTPGYWSNGELSNTEAELTALVSLEESMASELRYLQQRYDESTFNRTWKGQLFILMRHATGFYCIFRSLISISNIVIPSPHSETSTDSSTSPDLLASALLLLIPNPSPTTKANVTYAMHQVNLAIVGAVIIGSIQRVLHGAARALRATTASRNRVASLVLLVLAQLMGIYLLSTLIQLRTSFPPATDVAGPELFATLPAYATFGLVFDWSFLASASFAVVIEWMRERAEEL